MSRLFGVILAGGGGTRLGGLRKAEVRIGGVRLIDRAARVFEGRVDELLVAAGRFVPRDVPGKARLVADQADTPLGPLAGIRAAADTLRAEAADDDLAVFVAVDTPFLPENFVPRLTVAARDTGAAFAAWGDSFYPTNCAWRFGALWAALSRHEPTDGPRALLQSQNAVRVDWREEESLDPFANLNTLADLLALQRRALAMALPDL